MSQGRSDNPPVPRSRSLAAPVRSILPVTEPTWVFGYGSLIWKQDFPFLDSSPALISGWQRRFWQGSHDHRGTPEKPGRVLTLIRSPGERCTGRAFLVQPDVFAHLDYREKNGYERIEIDIDLGARVVTGLVYRASENNHAFLGPATDEEIARHIDESVGPSGANRDYLLELAAALRDMGAQDPHVFGLETALLRRESP